MTADQGAYQESLRFGSETVTIETGRVATQAGGAVWLRAGRAVLLATATARGEETAGLGFFPLTVEYREKLAGGGRIPGGFLRREGRAATREILTARLVDRCLRPHFPDGFRCETQIVATLQSHDPEIDPGVLAIFGAATALGLSDIPWDGPVAGVRIARCGGDWIRFPSPAERATADLDLIAAVSRAGLVMVEGRAEEVGEEVLLEALARAEETAAPLLETQAALVQRRGRPPRAVVCVGEDAPRRERIREQVVSGLDTLYGPAPKRVRREAMGALLQAAQDAAAGSPEGSSGTPRLSPEALAEEVLREEIRRRALEGRRLDGRGVEEIRAISAEIGCLPGAHGSSLFTRGETQALVSCTLGSGRDEQLVEDAEGLHRERFLLHYNFPPYSVGEVRPMRGPGRREIGHGELARRALLAVFPAAEAFPYTVRIESEITSSNGSSSMATVCGASLALMDAGVPIRPVAGVAMGLIAAGGRHVILSDILGDEDHLGDMDFKVAGTCEGITAVQLDNKLGSLPRELLGQALAQAHAGRLRILEAMARACARPRPEVPPHAPQAILEQVRPARIRDLIGPGGRHIQAIQQETGATIDVSQDGRVLIYGAAGARIREAHRRVRHYTAEPETGCIYRGRVTGVTDFGCFVEIFHGIEGLVPVSELDTDRVEHPSRIAAVGDEMVVTLLGATPDGKLRLSRRAALGAGPADIVETR